MPFESTCVPSVASRFPIFSVGKTEKSVNVTDSAWKILLSGAWICQENFIDSWINYTPCCETIIKTSRFPSLFLSHTKRET